MAPQNIQTVRPYIMHISTLRRQVEAMGGTLSLIAQFPDRDPVALSGFNALK